MIDMPPVSAPYQYGAGPVTIQQSRDVCISRAAAHYRAHPDLVKAVIRTESGTTGKVSYNKNGSYDMGLMQINSIHLPELSKFGITKEMLVNNECLNIFIGTYFIQRSVLGSDDFWKGVGNYHSRTPDKNYRYKYRVWNNLKDVRGQQ